jgi:hypothetical protein
MQSCPAPFVQFSVSAASLTLIVVSMLAQKTSAV